MGMTPRKAVLIGCLISAGVGVLAFAEFGSMIYHWCVTGELWTVGRSGIGGHFASYAKSPFEVVSFLGIYGAFTATGVLAFSVALFNMLYYWKRLTQ
jgi:hypothetical protein